MRGIAGAREESSAARAPVCEEEIERKQAGIQQQHEEGGGGKEGHSIAVSVRGHRSPEVSTVLSRLDTCEKVRLRSVRCTGLSVRIRPQVGVLVTRCSSYSVGYVVGKRTPSHDTRAKKKKTI